MVGVVRVGGETVGWRAMSLGSWLAMFGCMASGCSGELVAVSGTEPDGVLTPDSAVTLDASVGLDAAMQDAGGPDTGNADAGSPDAGSPDAGSPDAGSPDAGSPDAGDPGPIDTDAMGPAGRWPQHTPRYATTATASVCSEAELLAALDSASSGDVVEVTCDINSASIDRGSSRWTQNVLVRPPLGRRADIRLSGEVSGAHVTLAGFRTGGISLHSCTRCGAAWIEGDDNAYFQIDARRGRGPVVDAFFYELVTRGLRLGGDRMNVKAGAEFDNLRPQLVGVPPAPAGAKPFEPGAPCMGYHAITNGDGARSRMEDSIVVGSMGRPFRRFATPSFTESTNVPFGWRRISTSAIRSFPGATPHHRVSQKR